MTIRIHSPIGNVGSRSIDLAPAPDILAGLRLAVLDNGKPGAALLLGRAAELLAGRARIELVGMHRKRTAATPCDDALLEEISKGTDLVLTGTAD